jgi:hypothetical protein
VAGFDCTSISVAERDLLGYKFSDALLWLLRVEIVNLCKISKEGWVLRRGIKLVDAVGFEFEQFENGWKYISFDHIEGIGLLRFSYLFPGGPPPRLSPKVKVGGSIAFVLPGEERSYYLALKDGSMREV